jgi:hypothetical protein
MSYRPIEPADVGSFNEVRVILVNDREESCFQPSIEADTLRGNRASGADLAIPLDRVAEIQGGKVDAAKTVGLVLASVVVVTVVAFVGLMIIAASDPCFGLSC